MASLFVIQGRDQGQRFELDEDTTALGRDKSNPVQLHDSEISRRHAEIQRRGPGYVVTDLQSSNGTYVNGQRVEEHALASGDRLLLGRTLLLFTDPGEGEADLSDKIDIIAQGSETDGSRIIRSMSQQEGSRIFGIRPEPGESPWLARARSNLQVMYHTALAVSHTLDIDQLLGRIMQLIFEWVEADRGCIMLMDPETKALEPRARRNRRGADPDEKLTISKTILDYVIEHNEGVLTSNAREDDRWNPAASIVQAGIHEAMCVPMQGRYDVVGAIYIDTSTTPQRLLQRGTPHIFSEEHLKLMIAIAHQAALAVEDTRYYSAMVQAERLAAVGQAIAMLSHHVKNILQGIRGGSYLIEMGLAQHDEAVVRKGWGMVDRNQAKISSLVMDMLTFSKEREPDPIPGDLNHLVAEVAELMQSRAQELGVELVCQPDAELPTLTFDPDGIHRAVLNVLTNALDACEKQPGAKVLVATDFDPTGTARVIVTDNGPGIPPEEIDKVFSLFVSHKGSRGTGLGLPVTQKIVREHGGRVLVESQPGSGTTFTLELPVVNNLPQPLDELGTGNRPAESSGRD